MALSELTQEPALKRYCSVCQALDALPPAKAEILQAALENPRWRYSQIATKVSTDTTVPEWVRDITGDMYGKHVRGQCRARKRLRK